MNNVAPTNAEAILAALNSLTEENWHKGSYFAHKNNTLCMCSHGAVQAQINPRCRTTLNQFSDDLPRLRASQMTSELATSPALWVSAEISTFETERSIWNNRPDCIRDDLIAYGNNYGKREAHFLLGMVGLTAPFNDARTTTFAMVKEKFQQAYELAVRLGV